MSGAGRRQAALGDPRPSTDVVEVADGAPSGTHCKLTCSPGPFAHVLKRTSGV
jgi:hypothetical protein